MDSSQSAKDIPSFIKQHNLDTRVLYKDVNEFKTMNDFFARGIKVDEYRPILDANEDIILSPADCRMMLFESMLDSTKFWVKGSEFTLQNLVGSKSNVNIGKYDGGSFVIARLAPQDYHRWHYPLSGKIIRIEAIDGSLYTVNQIAINKDIDVYTDNKRCIVEIESNKCSYIMFVIAATMVGSYRLFCGECQNPAVDDPIALRKIGALVKRGDVAGEFRNGGSTILLLFDNKTKIQFDNDILRNVNLKFETLVNVRRRIGIIQNGLSYPILSYTKRI